MQVRGALMRSAVLILLAAILALQFESLSALGFREPDPLSNKDMAHRNIMATGGGVSLDGLTLCSSTGSATAINSSFSLGTEEKQRRIALMKALIDRYGLTPEQAAGPVGNFMKESSGTVTEAKKLPPNVNQDENTPAPPNSSGLGYSWAQWSGSRKTQFVNHMKSNTYHEKNIATDAAAFSYLTKELEDGYEITISELKKQSNPEDAAVSFEATFERAGKPALTERKQFARQAFEEYREAGGEAGGEACGSTGTSADFGEIAFPLKGTKKTAVNNPGIFADGTTSTTGHPYTSYDIMSPGGTPVVAFMSGVVSHFFKDTCGGDSVVIWNEEKKIAISYLHNAPGSIKPRIGQKVTVGSEIAKVGTDGKNVSGCGGSHLHIDASTSKIRLPCSRSSCSDSVKKTFRSMGPALYDTFQKLPD